MDLEIEIQKVVNQWIGNSDRFLVEVRVSGGKIAVFVDHPEGITIDDCSELSRLLYNTPGLAGQFDTHDLEVSSPGMDQPFMVKEQYLKRIGRDVIVETNTGESLKGILKKVDDNEIELLERKEKKENKKKVILEKTHKFNFKDIRETRLVMTFKYH